MILELFKHLTGYAVLHGSRGLETQEVIESITNAPPQDYLTVQFQSGKFTHIPKGAFDIFLEEGSVDYSRASGFFAVESLKDFEE